MNKYKKRIVWFNTALVQSGGGERLSLESVKAFRESGCDAYYVVYDYDKEKVFNSRYHNDSTIFKRNVSSRAKNTLFSHILDIIWLRKQLRILAPDIVITQGTWGQVIYVHLATLGTKINYSVHIFGSLFAFPPSLELTKYATVFRKHFLEIRNSLETYKSMVPDRPPNLTFAKKIKNEVYSFLKFIAVRNAKDIFVLSHRNQWEVQKLYNRNALVLKGAFPVDIFTYSPRSDLKNKLGLEKARIILSVCRLAVNKRVDLCIKAFADVATKQNDVQLIVGGTGPEENFLQTLVKELGIESRVKFVGYIDDNELWEYFSMCDVFVSLDLADFDIAPLEALALGKKVVWTNEMELDEILKEIPTLFPVDADIKDISTCILGALNALLTEEQLKQSKATLVNYSWEQYARSMIA